MLNLYKSDSNASQLLTSLNSLSFITCFSSVCHWDGYPECLMNSLIDCITNKKLTAYE